MSEYNKPEQQLELRNIVKKVDINLGKKIVLVGSDNMSDRTNNFINSTFYAFYVPNFVELTLPVSKSRMLDFEYGTLILSDLRLLKSMLLDIENITAFFILDDKEKINFVSSYLSVQLGSFLKNYRGYILNSMQNKITNSNDKNISVSKIALLELYNNILYEVYKRHKDLDVAITSTKLNYDTIKRIKKLSESEQKQMLLNYKKYRDEKEDFNNFDFDRQIGKIIVASLSKRRIL